MSNSRLARRLAYGVAALLVIGAGLLFLADWLIDRPAVKAAIQQRLSTALGGQIAWEGLDLHVLPAPHGKLRGVRLAMPAFSARADTVDAYLRLWPLLRGHPEIASLSMSRPEIRVAASGAAPERKPLEPLAAYRQIMGAAVDVLRRFAPDTQVSIEGAAIDVAVVQLRDLNVAARTGDGGLDLDVQAASNFWKHLRIKGRVEYVDLSARAEVAADGVAVLPDLPQVSAHGRLHTDARSAIEGEADVVAAELFDGARVKTRLPAAGGLQVNAQLAGLRVAPALAVARRWTQAIDVIEASEGRVNGSVDVSLGEAWRVDVRIEKSDAAVKLAQLPWKIAPSQARVSVDRKAVHVQGLHGTLGDSNFADAAARLELGTPLRLAAASGRATVRLEQWFAWLRERLPQLEEVNSLSGSADVTLKHLALRFDRPAAADFEATLTPRQVNAALKALPAPVSADGGSVQVDASRVRLDKVTVALLDAKGTVSGAVALKDLKVELALAEGALGEQAVQWALERGEVPARFTPKTPLRVAMPRFTWAPGPRVEADALVDVQSGPRLDLAFDWRDGQISLRRLAIKDARSDALLTARLAGDNLQAGFKGKLDSRSLAAMLRQPLEESGSVQGSMQVSVDRKRPERTVADGKLTIDALDLAWLTGHRAYVSRAELVAVPTGARILNAELEWEDQAFKVRGEVARTSQGPVVDAILESPGVVVERLLPAQEKKPLGEPGEAKVRSNLWPLPVTGRVEVKAGFLQFPRYRVEPLEGILSFERERASLDVKQARTCGLSFPLTFDATPKRLVVAALVTMNDEPLEKAMHCLTGGELEITGSAKLRAELRSEGASEAELVRNLTGTAQGEVRDGRVRKFALIGNILSLRDVVSLKSMEEQGFPYKSMTATGRFRGGEFLLDEGFFDSNAARIAANGRIDLYGDKTRLDVLLGLFTTVDRVAGAIPIVGDVFGGTMLGVPVSVNGDIRNPVVVPLGPRAVTDRMLGIFERTLKLPGKLVVKPPAADKPPATDQPPP